ncbi:MAG: DUF1844 domain-containing protein [Candidatus Sumerlaeaceae bacterium]|jgi:hypothetical protein
MSTTGIHKTFALLVQQHLTQALWFCGEVSAKEDRHLELAKLEISLLEIIQEKTRGNLTNDEQRLLADALHEARMAYVFASQKPKPEKVEQSEAQPLAENLGSATSSHESSH